VQRGMKPFELTVDILTDHLLPPLMLDSKEVRADALPL
jgi:hypothetical protein